MLENKRVLTAKMEPFDSFWEGPEDVEKGYARFGRFYRCNYLGFMPAEKSSSILVISCGPGYFVNMLNQEGYRDVVGIDSDAEKVKFAVKKDINCKVAEAFLFLEEGSELFDTIVCEQELNHLSKEEILDFLKLCHDRIKPGGRLIVHSLNGANPITGAEALAQNLDHYNSFTEYSLKQALQYDGFSDIMVMPLDLYVFYNNPANYVAMAIAGLYTLFFRFSFALYGKANRIFTKKIAAVATKP